MMHFRKTRGFTLIELLVVVSIIGVLSSTSLVAFQGVKQKTKDTKSFIEIKELTKALELYKLDNNSYPGAFDTYYVSSQSGANTCNKGNGTPWLNIFDATFTSKYISKLPTESQTCGIIYAKFSADNSGNPTITCKTAPDGLNDYKKGDYEYFLIVMTDPASAAFRNLGWVIWQYVGGASVNTDQKCLPGPMR